MENTINFHNISDLAGSDIAVQSGAITASGGTAAILKAAQIIAVVLGVMWWVMGAWSDLTDLDDKANMPSFIFGG